MGRVPGPDTTLAAAGALVLAVELVATLARRDGFWGPLAHPVAVAAEAAMTVGSTVGGLLVLEVAQGGTVEGAGRVGAGIALACVAGAWLLADLRRRVDDATPLGTAVLVGSGFAPATAGAVLAATGAVAVLAGPTALALTLASTATLLAVSGRPLGRLLAGAALALAPLAAFAAGQDAAAGGPPADGSSVLAIALGVFGAVLLAGLTRLPVPRDTAWLLAFATPLPLVTAAPALEASIAVGQALVLVAVVAWLTGLIVDGGAPNADRLGLGLVPRAAALSTLALTPLTDARHATVLAGLLVAGGVADLVRRRQPAPGVTLAVSVPALVLAVGWAIEAPTPTIGLTLAAIGALSVLAAGELPADRRLAAAGLALTAGALGTLLAAEDPSSTATLVLLLGATGLGAGTQHREPGLQVAGCLGLVLGVEWHLVLAEVAASEAYVAPVAALLVVAGLLTRRRDAEVSSWLAYGPGIALLGCVAVAERLGGGGGWHALVAGLLGVGAVLVGGGRRLAAPLFLGTALLVVVAGYESLAVTAGLPTWLWLAAGGTALLLAGIAMERHQTGPVEGGRRLVEVIGERFD